MVVSAKNAKNANVTAALIARYGFKSDGGKKPRTLLLARPPSTREIRSMGPLVRLEVRRLSDDKLERWEFDPYARLAYSHKTKRLWAIGGAYRIDGGGFHNTGSKSRVTRVPLARAREKPALRAQFREFKRTHYGAPPYEAIEAEIVIPKAVVALAYVDAVVYSADRNDGDGRAVPWKHVFEDEGIVRVQMQHTRPLVCTNTTGTWIYFHGGTYSLKDGWLVG